MKIEKIAKPGKIMPQPPKKPDSGKMDSQIFIGKDDPQHAPKKKKKKKKKKAFNLKEHKTAQLSQEDIEDVVGGDAEEYQLEEPTKKYVIEAVVTVVDVIEAKDEVETRWLFKTKYPESANQGSIKSVKTEDEFNVEFDKTVRED